MAADTASYRQLQSFFPNNFTSSSLSEMNKFCDISGNGLAGIAVLVLGKTPHRVDRLSSHRSCTLSASPSVNQFEKSETMGPEIKPVEGELIDLLNKSFANTYDCSWLRVNGCLLPDMYYKFSDAIENFEVRNDDVWVCSYPKTGTTWTQEMVWCIANDVNSEEAKVPLTDRFPYIDLSPVMDVSGMMRRNPGVEIPEMLMDSVSYVAKTPSPRFIKMHLPFDLLPRQIRSGEKKPKIMYVTRNPKDTCISFFHHSALVLGFEGNFEEFVELFLGETLLCAPFWKHVLSFWEKRHLENVLFIRYEDMKKDLPSVIKKVATFLGKSLTNDQVSVLNEHLSFASMKANPAANNEDLVAQLQDLQQFKHKGAFIRKGASEQWKTEMTPEVVKRFDDRTRDYFKGTGLPF